MTTPDFKDHFSRHAELYRRFRPTYPPEVFAWLASLCEHHDRALDVGTGNGQAAHGLAPHFAEVIATDASASQIAQSEPHPKIRYAVAPAEDASRDRAQPPVGSEGGELVAAGSVDLVLAAQALHWFDFERFFAECRRVLRPGGVVAALTYYHPNVTPEIDPILHRYIDHVRADWPPERRFVDTGYRTIDFPFQPEIALPSSLVMRLDLDLEGFAGYLATWSAAQRHRERTGLDPRAGFLTELAAAWGAPALTRPVTFPLGGRIGR